VKLLSNIKKIPPVVLILCTIAKFILGLGLGVYFSKVLFDVKGLLIIFGIVMSLPGAYFFLTAPCKN